MWQDKVIAICQLLFFVAMLPTIFGKDKPPVTTSFMNVTLVAIITISMATLHLWLAVITGTTTATAWLIVGIQKLDLKSAEDESSRL